MMPMNSTHSDSLSDSKRESQPFEQRRLLILDDSELTRELLQLELEGRGHLVEVASNLIDFQKKLGTFNPELIFLDINMPEMQGDEVCRQLRRRLDTQTVPIILLSSLPDDELAALAQRAGADGFLSKQHGMEELVAYLDDLLSQIIY